LRVGEIQDEGRAFEAPAAHEAPRGVVAVADPLNVRIRLERSGQGAGQGHGIARRVETRFEAEALHAQDLLRGVGQPRDLAGRGVRDLLQVFVLEGAQTLLSGMNAEAEEKAARHHEETDHGGDDGDPEGDQAAAPP